MRLTIILILVIPVLLVSCKNEKEQNISKMPFQINKEEVVTINQMTTDYDTLINNIINKGNRDSYDELFYSFMETSGHTTDSIMVYSKIMAEKYHYKRAYFDYFEALCRKSDVSINYGDYSSIDISKWVHLKKNQRKNGFKK